MENEKKGLDAQLVFKGMVPYSTADKHVKDHRKKNPDPKQGLGVYYSLDDIDNYVKNIFPALRAAQDKAIAEWLQANPGSGFDPNDYEWKVGFFWMEKEDKDDKKKKPDFYVVPVLVNKLDHKVVCDYYNETKFPFLPRPKDDNSGSKALQDTNPLHFSYNTGNMFP